MSTFFFAVLAGLVWMGLSEDLGWDVFAIGAALGLAIALVEGARASQPFGFGRALRMTRLAIELLVVFLADLVLANVQQLRVVLAPRVDVQPGWVRFPTRLKSGAMRALLGSMISLVPGSMTYEEEEEEDGSFTIGLHLLDARREEEEVANIRNRLESRLLEMEKL